jgi:twitching motility protein PilT
MITMDAHLLSLVNREIIAPDEAVEKAQDSNAMRDRLTQMGHKLQDL